MSTSRYRVRDLHDNWSDITPDAVSALGSLHRALNPRAPRQKKTCVAYVVSAPLFIAGIFFTWAECAERIRGVSGAKFLGYESRADAEREIRRVRELARAKGIRLPTLRRTT